MAIAENALIEFFGTQTDVSNSSASVATDTFSVTGDTSDWTNVDDAMAASVVLEGTYSVAPTIGRTVLLFAQLMNIVSTDDQDVPTANYQHVFLGAFPLKNVTSRQHIPIEILLPNTYTSQVYHFWIRNQGAQTISAGWQLWITPKSVGPHPA